MPAHARAALHLAQLAEDSFETPADVAEHPFPTAAHVDESFDDLPTLPGVADVDFAGDVIAAQQALINQMAAPPKPLFECSAHFANPQHMAELQGFCEGVEKVDGIRIGFRPLRMNDEPAGRIVGVIAGVFKAAA